MIRIIPSLLLSQKKLVKGTVFTNFKSAGSPVTTISALDNQKADEIFLIDLDSYKLRKKIIPKNSILTKLSKRENSNCNFNSR